MPSSAPYWKRVEDNSKLIETLSWNFPEQKQGTVSIIGGNKTSFAPEIRIAEYLLRTFPFLKEIKNYFPDSLKSNLPPLPNISFFPSTESGSFANSPLFLSADESSDKTAHVSLLLGDFSKNSETAIAVANFLKNSSSPVMLTRDTVDLVLADAETILLHDKLFIVASLAQLQKLFRAIFYPKMLLLSQPIFPVIETLHKFTLSYPTAILTFHEGQIICAKDGRIISIPLEKTQYSPISLWSGELAGKIAVFSLFNPKSPLDCLAAATTYK